MGGGNGVYYLQIEFGSLIVMVGKSPFRWWLESAGGDTVSADYDGGNGMFRVSSHGNSNGVFSPRMRSAVRPLYDLLG